MFRCFYCVNSELNRRLKSRSGLSPKLLSNIWLTHFIMEQSEIQWPAKNESSCLLSDCFSCISLEPLELQKCYLHLFASLSEELSDFFQIWLQNLLIFAKTLFWQKKVSYWKKSAIFFFMDLRFRNWTYIQTSLINS